MTDEHRRVSHETFSTFSTQIFREAGLSQTGATVMTDALMHASLRGVDTHGLIRLEPYARKLVEGGFNPDYDLVIEQNNTSVTYLRADAAPGPIAAIKGMKLAIEHAAATGIGAVVVTESNHFGMAAHYTLHAAEYDCIGLALSHGGPRVAPAGGVDPFFGTNPIAYSIPTPGEFHITHDMSTSAGANAKIRQARNRGLAIPNGWAVDETGKSTTHPDEVHSLQPVGGYKGYGLGLFVEVCSGILAGTHFAPEVPTPYENFSEPMDIGHLLVAIDVTAFRDGDAFRADIGELIDRLHKSQPADPAVPVRLPGERAARCARERKTEGIPVDPSLERSITAAANRFNINHPLE